METNISELQAEMDLLLDQQRRIRMKIHDQLVMIGTIAREMELLVKEVKKCIERE